MLKLKPNCEWCDKSLAADSTEAFICSYECTFCKNCVETVLDNVCPNCGGGFCARPIRPSQAYRTGVSREHQTPSNEHVNSSYSESDIRAFSRTIKHIEPAKR